MKASKNVQIVLEKFHISNVDDPWESSSLENAVIELDLKDEGGFWKVPECWNFFLRMETPIPISMP